MDKTPRKDTRKKPPQNREDRLKAALKSNMQRRKAQTRARQGNEQASDKAE